MCLGFTPDGVSRSPGPSASAVGYSLVSKVPALATVNLNQEHTGRGSGGVDRGGKRATGGGLSKTPHNPVVTR